MSNNHPGASWRCEFCRLGYPCACMDVLKPRLPSKGEQQREADYYASKQQFETKYRAWIDGGKLGPPPPRPIPPHIPGWLG